ncbi:CHAT domain-containing protein [Noviherbaspirillum sedimenti]|nr:CHAT domain-containing protein [Noviherbaspirillum sedimenti]
MKPTSALATLMLSLLAGWASAQSPQNPANGKSQTVELSHSDLMKMGELKGMGLHAENVAHLESFAAKGELKTDILFHLCTAYSDARQFGKMTDCFDKLRTRAVNGVFMFDYGSGIRQDFSATIYQVFAEGYRQVGDYRRAIDALLMAMKDPKDIDVHSLGKLGIVYAASGDIANARNTAKRLAAHVPTAQDAAVADMKHHWLAEIYMLTKDYALALEETEKFAGSPMVQNFYAQPGKFGEDSVSYMRAAEAASRGAVLLELGRIDDARASYDAALTHPRFSTQGDTYWTGLFNRGRIAEKDGKPADAIRYYRQAVEVIEQERSTIRSDAGKIGFVGDKQAIYSHLIGALIRARRDGEAFELAERAKARALVDMLASKENFGQSTTAGASLAEMTRLNAALSVPDRLSATAQQLERQQQVRRSMAAASERLRKADPELASLVTVSGIGEAELRGLLQPDETLVEFYYFGRDLYAFVATQGALRAVRLDGTGLAEQARRMRAAVQNPQSRDFHALGSQLYARLLAPLGLPKEGKLLIVPHGVLHYLPFNALAASKEFLVDRYSIRLLPSASMLKFLNGRKTSGKGLLVLGNPDLGNPQLDLPGAQKEAAEIARLHPDAKVLLRGAATKSVVKSEGAQYAWIHFASHGKFNPEQPLQSGLFLAPEKKGSAMETGTLTVDELYSLELNADLVTLSACETGLGKIDNGDDVIGLTRGFFYAGAASIIASLWEVDDQATYEMMTRFYKEVGVSAKSDALLKAQRAVKAKYPHPYYWAAFQLAGKR